MIYTVTLNPAIDKTVEIDGFALNALNRIQSIRSDPGGKGINVSKVIRSLGGESVATGILAGQNGAFIENALEEMGIPHSFLHISGETRTNLKVLDPRNHTTTDINEPGPDVSTDTLSQLLEHLLALAKSGDTVILSGSLPRTAPAALYAAWIRVLRERGITVFLDADGEPLQLAIPAGPHVLKPNREELRRLLGAPLETTGELVAAGQTLLHSGAELVVISLGGEGALFLRADGVWQAEGLTVPVGSTVGAGDSMVAALALSRERSYDMEQTIRLAMAASAAKVMCRGSQSPDCETIRSLLPQVKFSKIQ